MIINQYPKYKEKTKDLIINAHKFEYMLNTNTQMFKHKFNTTSDVKIDRFLIDGIEFKLNMFGVCAFFIYENRLLCEPCFFIGEHNVLGLPKDCYVIVNNRMAKQITFEDWLDNDDVIIMKNNKLGTTDLVELQTVANSMAEVDKSYVSNIINSRLAPLVKVYNEKDKNKIKEIYKHIQEGKLQVVDLDPSLLYDENDIEIVNLTDVNDSSKIQYLDLAKESIAKRYYQENGVNMNSSVKQAQQTVAEINDGSNSAFIYPSNKLEARTDCIDEFKEKFNISYTCEFNTCWKQTWEQLNKSQEEIKEEGEKNDVSDEGTTDNTTSDSNSEQPNDNNTE